ncbi:MAG: hypothetical protein ACTSYA_04850, partial [Candidatus Kariarchaeaceae archaeon]
DRTDLDWLLGSNFPNKGLIREIRDLLGTSITTFETNYLTNYYLISLRRQTRNLILEKFKTSLPTNSDEVVPVRELIISDNLEQEVIKWFITEKDDFPKKFMKNLSRLLTNRFKDLSQKQGSNWEKRKLDNYVKEVLGNIPIKDLKRNVWDILRKNWRDQRFRELEYSLNSSIFLNSLKTAYPNALLAEGILSSLTKLTPARVTREITGKQKRFWYTTSFEESWVNYLLHQIEGKTIKKMIETSLSKFVKDLNYLTNDLHSSPEQWFERPIFKAQSIPYGADDGNVFNIIIGNDPRKNLKKTKKPKNSKNLKKPTKPKKPKFKLSSNTNEIVIRLNLAKKTNQQIKTKSMTFKINEPERFYELLTQGYNNMAPTLTRKAGGALCLSFPFEKNFKKKKTKKHKTKKIMGVDSGLKTWASISIVEGLKPIMQGKTLSEDEFNRLFEGIDIGSNEVARYFLDQQELAGKATDWWQYPRNSREFFNSNDT